MNDQLKHLLQLAAAMKKQQDATKGAQSATPAVAVPNPVRDEGVLQPQAQAPAQAPVPTHQPQAPAPIAPAVAPTPPAAALTGLAALAARMKATGQLPGAHTASGTTATAAAAVQAAVHAATVTMNAAPAAPAPAPVQPAPIRPTAAALEYNAAQREAIALAAEGRGFCLIGAAGTGKTTTVMQIVASAMEVYGADAIANVAFTRRAVRNIRKACNRIPDAYTAMKAVERCSTIHSLLKYSPTQYDYMLPSGEPAVTTRFEPQYTAEQPLSALRLVIVDEASMVGLDLWKQLLEACPNAVFIFIGDLNQLKPVFGLPVLGFKLEELPVVELTQVYRQALESPIVRFQYEYTLRGRLPTDGELASFDPHGNLVFTGLTKDRDPDEQSRVFATYMKKEYEAGRYRPVHHAVLIPNRKLRGTRGELFSADNLNRWMAQWIGEMRGAVVTHVRAGMRELFLARGDYVLYGAEDYFIESVNANGRYSGRPVMQPSEDLTRLGWYKGKGHALRSEEDDFNDLLMIDTTQGDVQACSHSVTLIAANGASCLEEAMESGNTEQPLTLTSIGDFNEQRFSMGYAMSVHQSQGSEWEKVYLCCTHHAKNMRTRELLYTGMTRAAKQLVVVYSTSKNGPFSNSVSRAIECQAMPGIGWKQKVKYFAERRSEYEAFMQVPTQYGIGADNSLEGALRMLAAGAYESSTTAGASAAGEEE